MTRTEKFILAFLIAGFAICTVCLFVYGDREEDLRNDRVCRVSYADGRTAEFDCYRTTELTTILGRPATLSIRARNPYSEININMDRIVGYEIERKKE